MAQFIDNFIIDTANASIAPEHQAILRDASVWAYVFEEEDPSIVRLSAKQTLNIAAVFGHLLAWDILIQYLTANVCICFSYTVDANAIPEYSSPQQYFIAIFARGKSFSNRGVAPQCFQMYH